MEELMNNTILFRESGKKNRSHVIELVKKHSQLAGVKTIVVASSTGETGAAVVEAMPDSKVIVVSHSTGFSRPNEQELKAEYLDRIERGGGVVVTAAHAFGGVNRAVRKKLNTFQIDEIIAYTLRIFGEGMKVTAEIALMAADAGYVRVDEPIIAMAGTGSGSDTAVMLIPSYSQSFFEMKILEVLCMPAPAHPLFQK